MDLEELQSKYRDLYKMSLKLFNSPQRESRRLLKVEEKNEARRQTRNTLLIQRRAIRLADLSPEPTPKPVKVKSVSVHKLDRLTLLKQWKADKEKKQIEKKFNKKPAFKCCSAANVGFPTLKVELKKVLPSFAPKNHKFKAPENIKPIKMDCANNVKATKTVVQRVTRSMKPIASPPVPLPSRRGKAKQNEKHSVSKQESPKPVLNKLVYNVSNVKTVKTTTKKLIRTPKKRLIKQKKIDISFTKESFEETEKSLTEIQEKPKIVLSPIKIVANEISQSKSTRQSKKNKENINVEKKSTPVINSMRTPELNEPMVYVSPFVMVSRGKKSTKKENESRNLRGLPPYFKHTTPDKNNISIMSTSITYFHTVLDNEILRLQSICSKWNEYKESGNVTEDAIDMIDVAVGQANLLINKKFQQFRGLILNCQNQSGDKEVTCEDLQGFWDMVYIQVINLDKRFNMLTSMKDNNWEEIKPVIKKKAVKKQAPVKTAKSSSGLRAAINAARNKNKQEKVLTETSVKSTPNQLKTPNKTRKSLLSLVLIPNIEHKKRLSSPGIAMMNITNSAKSIGKLSMMKDDCTPRSILKNSATELTFKKTKVVLFKDDESNEEADLICFDTPGVKTRSSRLSSKN